MVKGELLQHRGLVMNKGQLIEMLTNNLGITKIDSKACVESVFKAMSKALARGERIEIRGFATFKLKEYSPYMGRNPKSGELIGVEGKKLPYFKMCKELKQRVNK
jgi:integration host factor subunit beta